MVYSTVPFQIAAICLVGNLVLELLCWAFIYRTSKFKSLKNEAIMQAAKLDALKAQGKDKGVKQMKATMDKLSAQLFFYKSWHMVLSFALMFALWKTVSSKFAGLVVAKLPFYPPGFVARISHSGLPGEDMTDCSAQAIYVLCQMFIKGSISKFVNADSQRVLTQHGQKRMLEAMGAAPKVE